MSAVSVHKPKQERVYIYMEMRRFEVEAVFQVEGGGFSLQDV